MSTRTYQTKVPENLIPFCEAMGDLFGWIERCLYKDIQRGINHNTLKRESQLKYGINARHFNSIYKTLKGKIASRKECHSRQIKELKERIKSLKANLKKLERKINLTCQDKRVKLVGASCNLKANKKTQRQSLKLSIHQKKRKLKLLESQLSNLIKTKPCLIFGGKKLWHQQFNLEENGYKNHQQWLADWQKARRSNFILIGSKDETQGNQICQLTSDGDLKIRVPARLESKFGKYVYGTGIKFVYGQSEINYALNQGIALTFRFNCKNNIWYINCTVDVPDIPYQTNKKNGVMGIDLNPNVVGWSICDREGNLKKFGQIKFNIGNKKTQQTEAILHDIVKELVTIASEYKVPIAVENLDFSAKKSGMKEAGVKYSRMLSNFAYSKFLSSLDSRGNKYGVQIIKLNPAYTSLIGLTKYLKMYGLSSDTAAGLVLARRALYLSERVPAEYASLVQVDTNKHVWSIWNKLNKKLFGIKRHSFFGVTNTQSEANLLDELIEINRSNRKQLSTSVSS